MVKKGSILFKKHSREPDWRTVGIIGAGRSVGVTHLAIWLANYLTGVKGQRTAVLEWNTHGDFRRLGDRRHSASMGSINVSLRILGRLQKQALWNAPAATGRS